ncbi:MAG: hypothetical protein OJF51_002067 [Nitrospira sp.]|nr:MAG: hypothetical protein OJF51_002067 [Nitrospira sp.]
MPAIHATPALLSPFLKAGILARAVGHRPYNVFLAIQLS